MIPTKVQIFGCEKKLASLDYKDKNMWPKIGCVQLTVLPEEHSYTDQNLEELCGDDSTAGQIPWAFDTLRAGEPQDEHHRGGLNHDEQQRRILEDF